MADDFSATIATTGRVTVNDVGSQYVTGNLETIGDHDWFRVWLWAGHTYVVREIDNSNNPPFGSLTLNDARVALHNSVGTELIHNDDGGRSQDSYLEYVTPSSGYYYVDAGAYQDSLTGTYLVSVTEAPDSLANVNQWGSGATSSDRFGDFNSDGSADLLQILANGTIKVSLSGETGFSTFTQWGTGGTASDQIGHVNNDNSDDLLQIYNGKAYVALSNGATAFGPYTQWASGVLPNAVLADINGDGKGDLYQSDATGHGFVALGNGTTAFGAFASVLTGTTFSDQIIARNSDSAERTVGTDFNGDGKADVLQFYNGTAYVALANAAGGFVGGAFQNWGNIGTTASDRVGDFNGDGHADLLQVYNGNAYVALANSAGTAFNPFTFWAGGATPADQIVDMNNDGRADLYQIYNGNAYVALANGDASGFTPYDIWAHGVAGGDRAIDVSGDGLADNVEIYNGSIYVWQSNGVPGSYHTLTTSWYDYAGS